MSERVATPVESSDCAEITISTFHALCAKILRQDAYRVGYKSNFSIYDEKESLSLLRKILPKNDFGGEKMEPSRIRARISTAKTTAGSFRAPAMHCLMKPLNAI